MLDRSTLYKWLIVALSYPLALFTNIDITTFIIIFAVVTLYRSSYACWAFWRYSKGLSSHAAILTFAMSLQLAGEAIMALITSVFSTAEHTGIIKSWSVTFKSSLRFLMFYVTLITTDHLVRIIKR